MICSQLKNTVTSEKYSCYVQNPDIAERNVDDTVFLVDPAADIVFYLDSLSTGIWHLLKEPVSIFDATNIVQQAFPGMSSQKIAGDVSKLIKEMSTRNLLLNDA